MCVCVCVCVYIYTYIHTHIYIYVCVCVCVCVRAQRCEDPWLFLEAWCVEGVGLDTMIIRIYRSNKYKFRSSNTWMCVPCIIKSSKLPFLRSPQEHLLPCNLAHFNPLNPELNPICYLLALLGAHHFLHVSRIRVKLLTFRLLISYIYIYGAPILDVSRSHTTTQHSR